MIRRSIPAALVLLLAFVLPLRAQQAASTATGVLHEVKAIQVEATVISNPEKVKEASAANLMQDSLKNAFRLADIQVVEAAPIRAHLILDEFTSGSTAKRFLVGFGAGRSTVTCRFVLQDAGGKELANIRIHVRGNLALSPYQGNNTQRRQAVSSLDQQLLEEIEKMK